jgi:hypothetical protein
MKVTSSLDPLARGQPAYRLVAGSEFEMTPDEQVSFGLFAREFDMVEPDAYMPETPPMRYRRHLRFIYEPTIRELHRPPHTPYVQSSQYNAMFGDVRREFPPASESVATGAFLLGLLKVNLEQIGWNSERAEIHTHFVRTVGRPQQPGEPAPEGLHRDGFPFISIHLIGRRNVRGGTTELITESGDVVFRGELSGQLDSLYVRDDRVLHTTSATHPAGKGNAVRDVLLCSYAIQASS